MMQARAVTPKKKYLIRLVRGESVLPTLTDFCVREEIASGTFSAIGAVERSKIGYYDLSKRQYGTKEYPAAMEVAAMTGNVALVNSKPFIHCHAVLSGITPGTENQPVGGHVFEATVAVTLEITLDAYEEPLSRTLDEEIGLQLLNL